MAHDDDLPLYRPTSETSELPPPRRSSTLQWILVGLAGVAAGALLTFWWMSRTQPATAPPPSAAAASPNLEAGRPKRQPIDLPALAESDALIRSLVSALSQHPTLARLLATRDIVRGSTLAVVQIGDGRTPFQPLGVLRPATHVGTESGGSGRLDAATYERWSGATGALTSIAPADAAQLYVNVKPLIDEAYIELGHSDGDFDAAIVRAIETLRSTPVLDEPPQLVKRAGSYEYADPALQALEPAQKQFLLFGPANQRRIVAWLEQVADALDLDLAAGPIPSSSGSIDR